MRRSLRSIASLRTGTILIATCAVLAAAVAFLPDEDALARMSSYRVLNDSGAWVRPIHFTERFQSPLFAVLLTAVFGIAAVSLYFRLRAEWGRLRSGRTPARVVVRDDEMAELRHRLLAFLHHQGYAATEHTVPGGLRFEASRGSFGIIGSILFHCSLLMLMAGIIAASLLSFRASVVLTEGETFSTAHGSYRHVIKGGWSAAPRDSLNFSLLRVDPDYRVGRASTSAAIVSVEGAEGTAGSEAVYINHALSAGGMELHFANRHGFSPAIRIDDPSTGLTYQSFIRLAAPAGPERTAHVDYLVLGDSVTKVELRLLPDPVFRNDGFVSLSDEPTAPLLEVKVSRSSHQLFSGVLPVGGEATGEGVTVAFPRLRRWAQLDVVDDQGSTVLLIGTSLASIGLLIRLLSVRRRVRIVLSREAQGWTVAVGGSSEKFPEGFRADLATMRADVQLLVLRYQDAQAKPVELDQEVQEEVEA